MHFQDETGQQAQVESRCELALEEGPTQLFKDFFLLWILFYTSR